MTFGTASPETPLLHSSPMRRPTLHNTGPEAQTPPDTAQWRDSLLVVLLLGLLVAACNHIRRFSNKGQGSGICDGENYGMPIRSNLSRLRITVLHHIAASKVRHQQN